MVKGGQISSGFEAIRKGCQAGLLGNSGGGQVDRGDCSTSFWFQKFSQKSANFHENSEKV
jgi:hypothetical protein